MGNSVGYIGLALVGGLLTAAIAGGFYYANSYNNNAGYIPTGMSQYGGRKTKHRKKRHNKSKRCRM